MRFNKNSVNKTVRFIAVLLTFIVFYGCITIPERKFDPSVCTKTVAVLPLKNNTTDVTGSDMVRKRMIKALKRRYYNVKPLKEVDKILRDQMGITLGGQLETASAKTLGEVLQVQHVVFGTLIDFGEINTGVYNVRKVRAKFKLVNTETEDTAWSRGLGVITQNNAKNNFAKAASILAVITNSKKDETRVPWVILKSRTNDFNAAENLGFSLGRQLIEKTTNTYLMLETDEMIRRILKNIP